MNHPLRFYNDRWQVLFEAGGWVTCQSKEDADALARSPELAMAAMTSRRKDAEFGRQLIEMAQLLEKHERKSEAAFFYKSAHRVAEATSGMNSAFDGSLTFPAFVLASIGDHVVSCVMDLSGKPSMRLMQLGENGDGQRRLAWFTSMDRAEEYRIKWAPQMRPVPIQNAFQALALLGNQQCEEIVLDPGEDRNVMGAYSLSDFSNWVRRHSNIAFAEDAQPAGDGLSEP